MSEEAELVPEVRKITQKIVGFRVKKEEEEVQTVEDFTATYIPTTPVKLERGDVLYGATYKVKQPLYWEHGFYLTLNNTSVNGVLVPFELFIESKNSECLPLLNVLALTLTSMFRLQINIDFLLEEYKTIQDPKGGYRGKKKGVEDKPVWYSSLVGEFADIIARHLRGLETTNGIGGLLSEETIIPSSFTATVEEPDKDVDIAIPGAQTCPKCHSKTYVLLDGCYTCQSCGESKCG